MIPPPPATACCLLLPSDLWTMRTKEMQAPAAGYLPSSEPEHLTSDLAVANQNLAMLTLLLLECNCPLSYKGLKFLVHNWCVCGGGGGGGARGRSMFVPLGAWAQVPAWFTAGAARLYWGARCGLARMCLRVCVWAHICCR